MIVNPKDLTVQSPKGFIVLDGVNGCGKSTLQARLAKALEEKGRNVVCTREPGGTPLGKELRALLQEGKVGKISERAELFLFAADRAEHVNKLIKPALSEGRIVLCDRYFYSTIAFQGYGRGLDLDLTKHLCEEAVSGLYPDLVLLLDLDPREGLLRIQRNRSNGAQECADTFEQEKIDFHERLRHGFLEVAKDSQTPFVVLDASKSPDAVFSEALSVVYRVLP